MEYQNQCAFDASEGMCDLTRLMTSIAQEKEHSKTPDHLLIRETDDKAELRREILSFVLSNQSTACLIVGFSFPSTTPFRLVTFGIRFVLGEFDTGHC